jgi:hypothetical protein
MKIKMVRKTRDCVGDENGGMWRWREEEDGNS